MAFATSAGTTEYDQLIASSGCLAIMGNHRAGILTLVACTLTALAAVGHALFPDRFTIAAAFGFLTVTWLAVFAVQAVKKRRMSR